MTEQPIEPIQPPQQSGIAIDAALGLVKGALGCVPGFGAFGAEALDLLVTAPNQRKQQRFWVEICEAIESLRQQGRIDFGRLAEDASFAATVSAVIQAVNRTAEQEKLAALRAAVLNSTGEKSPTESMRRRFVQAVDELSPEHVQLLKDITEQPIETYVPAVNDFGGFLRQPGVETPTHVGTFNRPHDPRKMSHEEFASWTVLLLTDLGRFGFAQRHATRSESVFMGKGEKSTHWRWRPTALGDGFLAFIAKTE
jgi:hypothetical protein